MVQERTRKVFLAVIVSAVSEMAEARLQRLEDVIHDLADCSRKGQDDREKRENMPTFKFKGNKQQYELNRDTLDALEDLSDLIEMVSVNRSGEGRSLLELSIYSIFLTLSKGTYWAQLAPRRLKAFLGSTLISG